MEGEADSVVFGEVVNFVEVVAEGDVGPAVGFEDGVVHLCVEAAELLDSGDGFVEGDGFGRAGKVFAERGGVFAHEFPECFVVELCFFGLHGPELPGVKEIVCLG